MAKRLGTLDRPERDRVQALGEAHARSPAGHAANLIALLLRNLALVDLELTGRGYRPPVTKKGRL